MGMYNRLDTCIQQVCSEKGVLDKQKYNKVREEMDKILKGQKIVASLETSEALNQWTELEKMI